MPALELETEHCDPGATGHPLHTQSDPAASGDEIKPEAVTELEVIRAVLKPDPIEGLDNYGIPPEPEGECDPEIQAKIAHFIELKERGTRLNDTLTKMHSFRNPSIMSKLIEYLDLDEYGSNYPKDMYDPHGFPPETYHDELGELPNTWARRPGACHYRFVCNWTGTEHSPIYERPS
ncbi:HCNGP-like protein-domain-containing protein [Polychytrium aggregatum]|uniref:HCNGP-like protein-domain-containing protein n=1 Tax=Polychytrium aggregatum TaxID=110093 RepID=UPI0022FE62F0|nr:HCNGP-like protein-domain-containing protein [Polychytrium aggregatum]KAI9199292.1 HCNGP-like protein-domain-containing protein [Polychytrium aggregatum]